MQHVFPDSGNYAVNIEVRDPQGRGDSKVFTAIMDAAPPRLYPPENPTGTSEIPTTLTVRAEDGAADVHQSRWDFNGDGNWDTPWVNAVQTEHTFAQAESMWNCVA